MSNQLSCSKTAILAALGLLLSAPASLFSATQSETHPEAVLISSPESEWPQWRGPRRDGICDEKGLLKSWPEEGPALLWKTSGVGNGYSSPIITGGRIYLTGDIEDELRIFAFDLEGRKVWQSQNGRSWKGSYPGARASCTYSEGRLYHLNAHGRVACLDAATGAEIWSVCLLEQFGGKVNTWAYSENLLVDGPRLIVTPGGSKALMAALDKKTGATIWTTEPLLLGTINPAPAHERLPKPAGEFDSASYVSPLLFQLGESRHLVSASLRHAFGVNADNGQLLWTRPYPTRYSVIGATPVLIGNAVFITAPDTDTGRLFRIHPENSGVRIETVWTTLLDTCHGCLVYLDGSLYGSWYRRAKGWACVDAATGKVTYQTSELPMGSILYADQHLYCLSQEGEMALIKPTPQGFDFEGRFRLVPKRVTDAWAHPVIAGGKLYLRFHDTLFCYDIRDEGHLRQTR
jgi:outer membrane protein assembly factor BamB